MSDLYIGLMSGTSMDAVDAALVDLSVPTRPILLATHSQPIATQLRLALSALYEIGANEINRFSQLDSQFAQLCAAAVVTLLQHQGIHPQQIKAIGSHGQTIRHHPHGAYPFSLQIGDPNIIASLTGVTTVADFRRRDIALGGQGAPLVPAFHDAVFRSTTENRAILNIGGIANFTLLPKNPQQAVIGFDTGPGNTLLDAWTWQHLQQPYDRDGAWAMQGKVDADLLNLLLQEPYFNQPIPKSTGRELFNLSWLQQKLQQAQREIKPVDVQTTLVELTAHTISQSLQQYGLADSHVFACGGGVKNPYLWQRLKILLKPHKLASTIDLGIEPHWVEAIAFAWLAQRRLTLQPGNLPSVTGAQKYAILGGIYAA